MVSLSDAVNKSRRALVVERHAEAGAIIKSLLSSARFRVAESDDGPDALLIASKGPCLDLLVSEAQPPGIDGWTLATSFLEHCPLGRIVLTSAENEVDSINFESPARCRFVPEARLADMLLTTIESVGLLQPTYVVLLAEDEPLLRNLVQVSLSMAGYLILTAVDGQEALDLSRAYPGYIDLVLSDIQMPRMHGTELAAHIRRERPGTEVLLVSGLHPDDVPAGTALFRKPFAVSMLAEKVRELLISREEQNGGAEGPGSHSPVLAAPHFMI
jgi:CheY-like chemotaxis protein